MAISLLSAQEGVTELVVVVEPALAALIDGGLADVVVLIKVAGPSLIADPGLFVDIVHSLAGSSMVGSLVLLKAEHSCPGEGKVSTPHRTGAGVAESTVAVLPCFTVVESPADALGHVPEGQAGMVAGLEGLHLPGGNGHVTPASSFVEVVVPSPGGVLVVDDPLNPQLHGLLQVGDIEPEHPAEHVGLRKSVSGDAMLVDPVLVAAGSTKAPLVFYAVFDEEDHPVGDGFAEFLRKRCFAVAEVCEEN